MLYSGYCALARHGEIFRQTSENGKKCSAVFAAGVIGASGKSCWKFLSISQIMNG
jgi:hypothetical protein